MFAHTVLTVYFTDESLRVFCYVPVTIKFKIVLSIHLTKNTLLIVQEDAQRHEMDFKCKICF